LDGEIDLTLQQDGSFDTQSPVTSSSTFAWGAPCAAPDVADTNPRVHLVGGYRASDGSLTIQQMQYSRDAWTYNSTCTIGGVTGVCSYDSSRASMGTCTMAGHSMPFPVPVPTLVGDLLGGAQLSLNLADGATLSIPAPPGTVGDWESSQQLAYPGT
jgi:hypothetical protein